MLAKRQLAEFVYDAVNLEGINFTLPEIQTLLDGITVGGHKVTNQRIALNQADTWRTLFELIENNQFDIVVEKVCALHLIAFRVPKTPFYTTPIIVISILLLRG